MIGNMTGGNKVWYKNGELHREDGPASEYPSGSRLWYTNSLRHRLDGPAIEWFTGDSAFNAPDCSLIH